MSIYCLTCYSNLYYSAVLTIEIFEGVPNLSKYDIYMLHIVYSTCWIWQCVKLNIFYFPITWQQDQIQVLQLRISGTSSLLKFYKSMYSFKNADIIIHMEKATGYLWYL